MMKKKMKHTQTHEDENTSGKNREEDKKQYLPSSSNSIPPFAH